MTAPPALVTRRHLILAGAAGSTVGVWWSNGLIWATQIRVPTIDLVGRDESQLLLLDTGAERLLVLSGPPRSELLEAIPDIMGLLRRRIDIVLSTESVFAEQLGRLQSDWHIGTAIALPEIDYVGSPRARATIRDPAELRLSQGVVVRCITHTRIGREATTWRMEISRGENVIGISNSLDTLSAVPGSTLTMAVAPAGSIALALRKSVASCFAMNARAIEEELQNAITGTKLVRIFDDEAARFEIDKSAIRLPEWASTIAPD